MPLFVGNLADRFGTTRTVAAGGVLYVIGMLMIAAASEGVVLTSGNVLCGVGMAAAGFGPIFGTISRPTSPAKRSAALGVATAGRSIGQFAIVPFVSLLQYRLDNWHVTMPILCIMSMLMVPLAVGLRGAGRGDPGRRRQRAARGVPDTRLLAADTWVFVCGFHVRFIGLHVPSYISDKAIGMVFFGRRISALEIGGWAYRAGLPIRALETWADAHTRLS